MCILPRLVAVVVIGAAVHTLCGAGPSGRGRGSGGSAVRARTAAVCNGLGRGSGSRAGNGRDRAFGDFVSRRLG